MLEWEETRTEELNRIATEERKKEERRDSIRNKVGEIKDSMYPAYPLYDFIQSLESGWPLLKSPYCELLVLAENTMEGVKVKKSQINQASRQLDRLYNSSNQVNRMVFQTVVAEVAISIISSPAQRMMRLEDRVLNNESDVSDDLDLGPIRNLYSDLSYVREVCRQAVVKSEEGRRRVLGRERIQKAGRMVWSLSDIKEISKEISYSFATGEPNLSVSAEGTRSLLLRDLPRAWETYVRYQPGVASLDFKPRQI